MNASALQLLGVAWDLQSIGSLSSLFAQSLGLLFPLGMPIVSLGATHGFQTGMDVCPNRSVETNNVQEIAQDYR